MNNLISLGACSGETPEKIEMALSLTGSRNGIVIRSSGSTSDSRYEEPLDPRAGPRIEERGWEEDSLRHERPFEVIWGRRDRESGLAGADPEEEPAAGTGPAC